MAGALNGAQAVRSAIAILLVFIAPMVLAGRILIHRMAAPPGNGDPSSREQSFRDSRMVLAAPTAGFLLAFLLDITEVVGGQPYDRTHWIFEGVTSILGGLGLWACVVLQRKAKQ